MDGEILNLIPSRNNKKDPPKITVSLKKTKKTNQNGIEKEGESTNDNAVKLEINKILSAIGSKHSPRYVFWLRTLAK